MDFLSPAFLGRSFHLQKEEAGDAGAYGDPTRKRCRENQPGEVVVELACHEPACSKG